MWYTYIPENTKIIIISVSYIGSSQESPKEQGKEERFMGQQNGLSLLQMVHSQVTYLKVNGDNLFTPSYPWRTVLL